MFVLTRAGCLRRASLAALVLITLCPLSSFAQASFTAQLRGAVTDSNGDALASATVTITDDATNISTTAKVDDSGLYVLSGLRPGTYSVKAEAAGFDPLTQKNVVLAVSQQSTLNFSLKPAGASVEMTVVDAPPLLDTESATLGTDVSNEYVRDIPLSNRSMFGLVFLAGGVSETTGAGTNDNYPAGTNFVSNGQRNATAEIRLDGALTSAPEQGEGATTNVYYQPSVEIVQEFKVQNNSFSAEYGNNGGTVVNIVLKSGGNEFHGSGWWFLQRSALDANNFFNNATGTAKPDHTRDQYGIAVGGPIKREKTFFFADYERIRQKDPVIIDAIVPTALEREGNFSQTFVGCPDPELGCEEGEAVLQRIFDPFSISGDGIRQPFAGNRIPSGMIDPIGRAIINLYPMPNLTGTGPGEPNYHTALLATAPGWQFDVKIDHHFSEKMRISGRYSYLHNTYDTPTVFGDGEFNDGVHFETDVHNASLEHTWSLTPTMIWTNRVAVDRAVAPGRSDYPDATSVGFPPLLTQVNGVSRMPVILMDNNATSIYDQCCVDTAFAHSLYSYSSSLSWVKGRHALKFGGEQRLFFNNFYQPDNPTGYFHFGQTVTAEMPDSGDPTQGNSFASLLLGYGDNDSGLSVKNPVADKSVETAFYVQDDWKITSRLTLNLGLRYEWSTPYTERFDRLQFSDFAGESGISVPISAPFVSRSDSLRGTTVFVDGDRHAPVDRNNFAPRIGFAFAVDANTVVRGGAGMYYGLNVATNFQYAGTAFRKDGFIRFTKDNFRTRFATLANPFPSGLPAPQGQKYGPLALWGFGNSNDLATTAARNAEIYQWNLGVQRLFPGDFVIAVDYSGSRSTHLPWGGYSSTRNRNFVASALLAQVAAFVDPTNDSSQSAVSDYLYSLVDNPFQPLFVGPNAIFDEPDSIYNDDQIPLINLLRPYPQFDGSFEGLPLLAANASYHSLQIRFEKRPGDFVSFVGNYTLSKATDDSSIGANAFVGNLNLGNPQQLDNLAAEHGISANDATHRLSTAVIFDIPVGRERLIGREMPRYLDAVVGGWSVSAILTLQSGQPIAIALLNSRLIDGNQRPNVGCTNLRSGLTSHEVAATGQSFFNLDCFSDPGDQRPGNAPRYFSQLRGDGVHNLDVSLSKSYAFSESMKLQVRAEFFNFTNTPRFAIPDTAFGSSTFGQIFSTANSPRTMQIGARFEF